jgi:hypothetical protein
MMVVIKKAVIPQNSLVIIIPPPFQTFGTEMPPVPKVARKWEFWNKAFVKGKGEMRGIRLKR